MVDDLKIIKKHYGEKMSHLCRELFPTLLEEPGWLSNFMLEKFEPNKLLYEDIIMNGLKESFKNFVLSFKQIKREEVPVTKTPSELLSEAGYDLYECKTEADIQSFRKYFAPGEELCTFNGGRLERCHVFFAVRKDVDKIKRKNFSSPRRQDEYGTSVMSIQFSRGSNNTVSIKNRYNHTVDNPDATYGNNLDNIVYGLTDSFEETYGFNLSHSRSGFEIPGYVRADKYYKYNYEFDNIYYCTDNLIIDNFTVDRRFQQKERYILFDYYILDLQEKTLSFVSEKIDQQTNPGSYRYYAYYEDTFCKSIGKIKEIKVIKDKKTGNRIIYIHTRHKEPIEIEINKANQMVRYKNNHIRKLRRRYLNYNKYLEKVELRNVTKVESCFLYSNRHLVELIMPKVLEFGESCLYTNRSIRRAELPATFFISDGFLGWNQVFDRQPVGVKNRFVRFIRTPDWSNGPIVFFHMLIAAITNQTIKLSNKIMNKRDYDFSGDEVTITSIKKTNAFSHLIDFIISKKEPTKTIEDKEKGNTL